MRLSLATLAATLALSSTTSACLVLSGVINHTEQMMISLVDNGSTVCSYWGPHSGLPQGLTCQPGFAAWVQLKSYDQTNNPNEMGTGVCAYSTGYGAHNYRFNVGSKLTKEFGEDYYWTLSARNYC